MILTLTKKGQGPMLAAIKFVAVLHANHIDNAHTPPLMVSEIIDTL